MNTNDKPVNSKENKNKNKPVYIPKPITPQTAINDDISKFFNEDDR